MACIVQPVLEVIGNRDNKPRGEMDAIAEKVGLDFIVNTVLDEDKNMLGVFAGHFVEAHRAACAMAEQVMVIPIPAQADILIVSANPCHFDYWQGIKPYAYSHRAVREGGIIIFMLDGTEGLCGDAPSHEPTVRKYLPWSFQDQKAAVDRGEVDDLVGLNVPMYHATLRHRVKKTVVVTNHLAQEDLDVLEFDRASSVQAALEEAFESGSGRQSGYHPLRRGDPGPSRAQIDGRSSRFPACRMSFKRQFDRRGDIVKAIQKFGDGKEGMGLVEVAEPDSWSS